MGGKRRTDKLPDAESAPNWLRSSSSIAYLISGAFNEDLEHDYELLRLLQESTEPDHRLLDELSIGLQVLDEPLLDLLRAYSFIASHCIREFSDLATPGAE